MGMRTAGPACCCCNNLYTGTPDTLQLYRHKISGNTVVQFPSSGGWEFREGWRSMDFDPVHKKVFASFRTPPLDTPRQRIVMLDDDFTNEVVLATAGGSESTQNITSDSDGQRVFYLVLDVPFTTSRRLYTVNHDGSGNSYVADISNTDSGEIYIPLHYCRANSKIYYVVTNGANRKLHRINDDGSGDTVLADKTQPSTHIWDCTVDNVNEVLWWIENIGTLGAMSRIWKSDLDGGGPTLVYSGPPSAVGAVVQFRGVQWSHKNERLYWWEHNNALGSHDPTRGWFSCKGDGSDVKLEIPKTNQWPWGSTPIQWRLGCGFEDTGPASKA